MLGVACELTARKDSDEGVDTEKKGEGKVAVTPVRGAFCPSGKLVCVHLQGEKEDYVEIYRLPASVTSGDNNNFSGVKFNPEGQDIGIPRVG